MKVIGIHRTVEVKNVEVEISPEKVLYEIYWSSLKDKPKNAAYIFNGFWYVESGYNCHTRDDTYSKDRVATDDEISIYNAYRLLKENLTNDRTNQKTRTPIQAATRTT